MAGKLVLYDNPVSSNAVKVRFLLAELGLEYEKVEVGFERPRPEWLTAWHPFGTIPALEDGDFRLGESNAILRYLAHRERRHDLYPEELRARALVDWAMDAWSTGARPTLLPLERALILAETPDHEAAAAGAPAAIEALDRFERLVSDAGTVCASGFTIADCNAGPVLWRTYRLELPFERWPRLARIRDEVTQRPAFLAAGPVR